MGISGLLPILKSITQHKHVSKYHGQSVAVDGYSWLHKGAYSCARELCEGLPTERCVTYCMQRVRLLQDCGVTPVIVFDGGRLPMKLEEEGSRTSLRLANLEKARAFAANGNQAAAVECYQKAVDISPAVAKGFIQALQDANVEFIVAPYEADAQMAFLAIKGKVHAIISEDSDMLAYGCPRVFFKMDKTGDGQEICLADLGMNRGLSFIGFNHQMFLEMCIFAGCDFLKAIPGIGMKKAHQNVRKCRHFVRVCKCMRFSGVSVPKGYEAAFQRAIWTFRHQRVFNADTGKVEHLHPVPEEGLQPAAGVVGLDEIDSEYLFLGPPIADSLAAEIARGDLDPITQEPFAQGARRQSQGTSSQTPNESSQHSLQRPARGSSAQKQKGLKAFFCPVRKGSWEVSSLQRRCQSLDRALSVESDNGDLPQVSSLPSRFRPSVAGCSNPALSGSAANQQPSQEASHAKTGGLSSLDLSRTPFLDAMPSCSSPPGNGRMSHAKLQQESSELLAEAEKLLGPSKGVSKDTGSSGGDSGRLFNGNSGDLGAEFEARSDFREDSDLQAGVGSRRRQNNAAVQGGRSHSAANPCSEEEKDGVALGLPESPDVEAELERMSKLKAEASTAWIRGEERGQLQNASSSSQPGRAETSDDGMRSPPVDRAYYAVITPATASVDVVSETEQPSARRRPKSRTPLSPVNRREWVRRNDARAGVSDGEKRRKISDFFKKAPKAADDENSDATDLSGSSPQQLARDQSRRRADARFGTGNPWSAFRQPSHQEADPTEPTAGPSVEASGNFHSLEHLPQYGATAAKLVGKLAARRNLDQGPATRLAYEEKLRQPFRIPKTSAGGGMQDGNKKKAAGRFGRFAFKSSGV